MGRGGKRGFLGRVSYYHVLGWGIFDVLNLRWLVAIAVLAVVFLLYSHCGVFPFVSSSEDH